MAADEWGASRATGVRVGRMWGLSRWVLIWPMLLPPPFADQLVSHNGTEQQQTQNLRRLQMRKRGMWYIKSTPDCQASQIEIHH